MDDYVFTYVNRGLDALLQTKTIQTIEYSNVDGSGDESIEVKFTDGSSIHVMGGDVVDGEYKLGTWYTEPDGKTSTFYPGYDDLIGKS